MTHKPKLSEEILVKCEQCGRWTPVTVTVDGLEFELKGFKVHYRERAATTDTVVE